MPTWLVERVVQVVADRFVVLDVLALGALLLAGGGLGHVVCGVGRA